MLEQGLLKQIILALTLVTVVMVAYMLMTSSHGAFSKILSINGLLAFTLIQLGWFASAVRLKVIVRDVMGVDMGLFDTLEARYLGGLIAYITPTAIGGEPARAAYISLRVGNDLSSSYAIALYEVFFDVVTVSLAGLFLSLLYLPHSIPVLIIALFVSTSWLGAGLLVAKTRYLSSKLQNWLDKASRGRARRFLEAVAKVEKGFRESWHKTGTRGKIIIVSLTALNHLLYAAAPLTLIGAFSMKIIIDSVSAYFMMQTMAMLPTPGGAGAAEYGLSISLPPEVALGYRVLFYYPVILVGVIVMYRLGGELGGAGLLLQKIGEEGAGDKREDGSNSEQDND